MSGRGLIRWTLRVLVGGVFVYAGSVKLGDPASFAAQVEGFRLVRGVGAGWIAAYLPWLEVVAGLCLLGGPLARGATVVLSGLLVAFLVALLSAWARGIDVACGCFGGGADAAGGLPLAVLRNVGLLAALWVPAWWVRAGASSASGGGQGPAPSEPPR